MKTRILRQIFTKAMMKNKMKINFKMTYYLRMKTNFRRHL